MPAQYLQEPPEAAYLHDWHMNMSAALKPVVADSRNGVFNAACFIHTTFSNLKPLIDGTSYIEVRTEPNRSADTPVRLKRCPPQQLGTNKCKRPDGVHFVVDRMRCLP